MASLIAQRVASCQAVSTSNRISSQRPLPCASRRHVVARSTAPGFEKSMMGEDFGARDPYAAEIESNFGEKVLGNWNTEHLIKPPDAMGKIMGLKSRSCLPDAPLLEDALRERYRQQVPGWRVQNNSQGKACIRQDWNAKDGAAAAQLQQQITELAAAQNHTISHTDIVGNTVVVELTTAAAGGLTENDFIVAAHINDMDMTELLAKKKARFWA